MAGDMRGLPITVRRYVTDRYGDRTEVSSHRVFNTLFAPRPNAMGRGSNEFNDRADQVIADAELYAPFGADIASTDVIELANGDRWEAFGAPERWQSGGWQAGTVIPLRRLTG